MTTSKAKPITLAMCAALVGGFAVSAPAFALEPLARGYMLTAVDNADAMGGVEKEKDDTEGKCGEGKCGTDREDDTEGKCGEGKCGAEKEDDTEGKCGEGKCGSDS
jgi:uncharacterized low-complexity protein